MGPVQIPSSIIYHAFWLALLPQKALAQIITNISGCDFVGGLSRSIKNPDGAGFISNPAQTLSPAACIPLFIGKIIQFVLGFVGAFCLINIMIGGYQIALGSAVGDKEAGKSRVLWALIGLFVSLISYGLLNLIITTLNL